MFHQYNKFTLNSIRILLNKTGLFYIEHISTPLLTT